jgi:hypothetical protein
MTLSTAWQRVATIHPVTRSHLSPDGGGLSMTLSTAWQRVATVGGRGIELLPRSVLTLGLVSGEKALDEQSPKRDQHDQDSSL